MSLINSLLGIKEEDPIRSALREAQKALFALYGAAQPTDAQQVKASVYLCIAVIANLNNFGRAQAKALIDRVAKEPARSFKCATHAGP